MFGIDLIIVILACFIAMILLTLIFKSIYAMLKKPQPHPPKPTAPMAKRQAIPKVHLGLSPRSPMPNAPGGPIRNVSVKAEVARLNANKAKPFGPPVNGILKRRIQVTAPTLKKTK